MNSPKNAIQKAVYGLIAPLVAPVKVYDEVPQGANFPYVVLGDMNETPWNTKNTEGREVTFAVHTWADYKGYKEATEMLGGIISSLLSVPLNPVDFRVKSIVLEISTSNRDKVSGTRHGVALFKMYIEED